MNVMPEQYLELDDSELIARILKIKSELGDRLVILGHHYQRDAIIKVSDFTGDSFKLAKLAAQSKNAKYIVFCGVHFMAEAAAILANPDQIVLHPDMTAGCPLADYATIEQVEQAWNDINHICSVENITPVTYVNSHAELKAFCGRNNGIVCTSSNAAKVFDWGFSQREKMFFFPDQHLGRNTANSKSIPKQKIIVWDPDLQNGGNSIKSISRAQIILWNGYCHVHTWFTTDHIKQIREKYPDIKIVVHPECPEEVVGLSDAVGSTEYIIQYVNDAAKHSKIAVGTELNLVNRLASQNPDKTIIPLARSLCPNMYKINLRNLCWTLEEMGKVNQVIVPADIAKEANVALERMLKIN